MIALCIVSALIDPYIEYMLQTMSPAVIATITAVQQILEMLVDALTRVVSPKTIIGGKIRSDDKYSKGS